MRGENAGLAFEAEDRAIDVWLLEDDAGVIGQVTRWEVVRAVHDDVVLGDDFEGVFAGEPRIVENDLNIRVDAADGLLGRFRFGTADVFRAVNDLALKIREIDGVEINDPDLADAGGGQVHGDRRAESARTDAEDAGGANFLLARHPDFGQDEVT